MSGFEDDLQARLAEIEAAGLRRTLRVIDSPQGAEVVCDGRLLRNFSSNDYLGLADHPVLKEAAREALEKSGTGSGASRLICGNNRLHEDLEGALAEFKGTEAALAFSTGYAAAVGTVSALVTDADVLILDKLCHASLVDGARLSGAVIRVFPHNHLGKLESHLKWAREKHPRARVLVVTESIYSMDGDRAPLQEIVDLKDRFGARLMVDEAHGVGVAGTNGRGLSEELGVSDRIEIQMGTLGKALGSAGAYICGSARLRDLLINKARSFIFSTAPAPHVAAASLAAVQILASPEGETLRQALWDNIRHLGRALMLEEPSSAIVPVILGEEQVALSASRALLDEGFLVPAIRYPTVARGAARLRLTLTAIHTPQAIEALANAMNGIRSQSSTSKENPADSE